jgi:hypothetical protein
VWLSSCVIHFKVYSPHSSNHCGCNCSSSTWCLPIKFWQNGRQWWYINSIFYVLWEEVKWCKARRVRWPSDRITSATVFRCVHSHSLTPWSRVLLEKLTDSQLVKKFPTSYGTRRFITAFISAHHLSLPWTSSIWSMPSYPTSWRSILILYSHLCLGLPSCLLPSGFPTKTLYLPLFSPICATGPPPSHSSLLNHPTNMGWGVQIINLVRT